MKTIYHLYAERGNLGNYGETSFGYFSSRKKAEEKRKITQKQIIENKDKSDDGYFDADWHIIEIKVY